MASQLQGYYRFPTIHEDRVVFVAEDDLWEVPASGGVARRLTTSLSTVATPRFSPGGQWLAFMGAEDGPQEVYLMPSRGGQVRRLTWLGSAGRVLGWRDDQRILFASVSGQPLRQPEWIFLINRDGTELQRLAYGPANRIGFCGNITVLGRRNGDPARWKRYRGGTAGDIWIDPDGGGEFRKLIDLKGNLADPMLIGARVYFLSDHDGIGNVYSSYPNGSDLQRHTDHREFYARNASSDGRRIVYHAGADLYVFDPQSGASAKIEIAFHCSRAQTHRKFVEAARYLQDYDLAPNGSSLALVCRGKSFAMGCWEWPVAQQGARQGVRYRLSRFLNDGKRLVLCSDMGGEDHLEIHWIDGSQPPARIVAQDLGRPTEMKISPVADAALITNHRQQLLHVNLESGEMKALDHDKYQMIGGFCWSPDGRWAAYGSSVNIRQSVIKVCEIESGEIHAITRPILSDYEPAFDPEGKYLYFLSGRIFNPVYDRLLFDAGFPRGAQPFAITLRKDLASPFVPEPEGFGKKKKDSDNDSREEDDESDKPESDEAASGESGTSAKTEQKKIVPIVIDFDGIEDRIVAFPAAEGIYGQIAATKRRIFYTTLPVEGALGRTWFDTNIPAKATLKAYDFKKREEITVADGITNFQLSRDRSALAIQVGRRLRVVAAATDSLAEKDKGGNGDKPGRKSGWIDLDRPKVAIEPTEEWRQMLAEAWRLQRDYFWTEDMSKVDWDGVL
ncbi:MAG: peptidase, partial [Candidatus Sumerlaeota bacterium]|nr:peptidase [Candidatus Sumerlaeota bacterium]